LQILEVLRLESSDRTTSEKANINKGRFWWAGSGQNYRCTAHGGFSLAEVLVPVMSIESF